MAIALPKPVTIDLRERVRIALSETDEIDTHKIAATIIASLSPDEMPDALAQCLPELVYDVQRERSRGAVKSAGSAKWDRVAEQVEAQQVSLRRIIVATSTGRKYLNDCTPEDVSEVADAYKARAEENVIYAGYYRRLREVMDKTGVAAVRMLTDDDLRGAFS